MIEFKDDMDNKEKIKHAYESLGIVWAEIEYFIDFSTGATFKSRFEVNYNNQVYIVKSSDFKENDENKILDLKDRVEWVEITLGIMWRPKSLSNLNSGVFIPLVDYKPPLKILAHSAKKDNKACPNCKSEYIPCKCIQNKCRDCGKPVGNITFSVCDDCWDKNVNKGGKISKDVKPLNANQPDKPVRFKPAYYAFIYQGLQHIAREMGYNLLLHGSMNRDMDLVCVKWADDVKTHYEVLDKFCEYLGIPLQRDPKGEPEYMFSLLPGNRSSYVINIARSEKFNNYHDEQTYIDICFTP